MSDCSGAGGGTSSSVPLVRDCSRFVALQRIATSERERTEFCGGGPWVAGCSWWQAPPATVPPSVLCKSLWRMDAGCQRGQQQQDAIVLQA